MKYLKICARTGAANVCDMTEILGLMNGGRSDAWIDYAPDDLRDYPDVVAHWLNDENFTFEVAK
jgi:hypothetical protein